MNISIIILSLLSLGYIFDNNRLNDSSEKATSIILSEPYKIDIQIKEAGKNEYRLVIKMELQNGAHFVSPNAKRDFTGKFFMDLGSYEHLAFDGTLVETPRSVEEIDPHPFVGGPVNWVRENTTYTQSLKLLSNNDFEVFGRIRFTIEPRCTLEEISFAISYKNGVAKIINNPKC
jgi:hypothetical protein